ncbi:GyrI-like domain-containing protein [Streptomyces wuyuanensis]|uniref:Effector-binding domain-containing protein n=1 Tax=Streptomyces wuyuanensis TaxID=1196353 RepID=A0A1G9VNB1_9ACTN|nr:GyrI-like domain-containing protein [Streptomyces wuyuanensis]SDM73315.1 effector-binding domain-containing protein [Streptomyces wuyuanensis]
MSETAHHHPTAVERPEQTYVAVRRSVRMDGFAVIADRLPEIFAWLASHGAVPAGPPFFRFHTVDMDGESDVEAGVPVDSAPAPEGDIAVGTLPAGRYGTLTHHGHPDKLFDAITRLRAWAAEQGLEWEMTAGPGGVEHWGCRVESYLTDPRVEPDMDRWETELAFRLAD